MNNQLYDTIVVAVRELHPKSKITLVNKGSGVPDDCRLVLPVPSKFSWRSIKDWFRAWWRRNVIDDYENLWPS